ncbi:protein PHLOEM PROTEIN 2-LIKE A1-like [Cucumis melo var. makuwa]|uniref:Protein PHLOEM PROTEIN 2-LIKE A1-like n=2 Tax=Cucumis melo var. makuwa TaxID=1194695 RepID=A0A5A7TN39_CUCMM|nr:protein PHLOEM PROTEIN 2-LIKE A1-like [Cucumis melo var. makuwa]
MNVCWLEIHGKMKTCELSPGICYEAAFEVMIKDPAYGWDIPVNIRVKKPDGSKQEHQENLEQRPRGRWFEIPIGNFIVRDHERGGEIEFCMFEYEGGMWKKGMVLKGVVIRSKGCRHHHQHTSDSSIPVVVVSFFHPFLNIAHKPRDLGPILHKNPSEHRYLVETSLPCPFLVACSTTKRKKPNFSFLLKGHVHGRVLEKALPRSASLRPWPALLAGATHKTSFHKTIGMDEEVSISKHPMINHLDIFRHLDSLGVEDQKDVKMGYSIMFGASNGVNGEKKGKKRPLTEDSFFSWFGETDQKDITELHDEVAEIIKEDLWPNPLKYFNNGAITKQMTAIEEIVASEYN